MAIQGDGDDQAQLVQPALASTSERQETIDGRSGELRMKLERPDLIS